MLQLQNMSPSAPETSFPHMLSKLSKCLKRNKLSIDPTTQKQKCRSAQKMLDNKTKTSRIHFVASHKTESID